MEKDKKYYWLKLKRDFFKRHDITIIEAMPNGKDYILFYLKLLCESVDHEGQLRFSDTIPYDENMLSSLTRTNIDIVRSAMKIFTELKMVDVLDDKTIFMSEIKKMIGAETYWAEKKRQQRIGQCPTDVQQMSTASPTCPSKSKSIEYRDKSIEIKSVGEKQTTTKQKRVKKEFIPPTLEDVKAYAKERNSSVDPKKFFDYFDVGKWVDSKGNSVSNWKQKFITWENRNDNKQGYLRGEVSREL